jgi:FPC/CPF motif-containing protein YcgG
MTGTNLMRDTNETQMIIDKFSEHLKSDIFPCIAAKAALVKNHIRCEVFDHMSCAKDDENILQFLYGFIDAYRNSTEMYHSAAVIFKAPVFENEDRFDEALWKRLQALSDLDAMYYAYDKRVSSSPGSSLFSYSLKEEAFYIIGLHPSASRLARQFEYPALIFNPHAQFENLRELSKYENMKMVVRKRELANTGSVNPMLKDFGEQSEVFQYSGRNYNNDWQCPLKVNHGAIERDTTT